jgi:hypothetical protein
LHPRGDANDLCSVQGGTSTNVALGDEFVFPVVLTTGPEEILCSGRVGSRAPIRGPLPLLGPAAGSVGSLRRMSQGRRFRCETGKLTLQSARWRVHNSTEVLEIATKLLKPITSLSYALEGSHVRTLHPITNPNFQGARRRGGFEGHEKRQGRWGPWPPWPLAP